VLDGIFVMTSTQDEGATELFPTLLPIGSVDAEAVAPPPLQVHEDVDGVVCLTGELDIATAPQLQTVLRQLLDGGAQTVVVDVAKLSFCDSTGLSVFVAAHRDLAAGLVIRQPSPPLQKLLRLTGMETQFTLI
jgi:anti-sigma B factor antagonist